MRNLIIKDIESFKLIIVESQQTINELNRYFSTQKCNEFNYNTHKYSIYKNLDNRKIIIQIKSFPLVSEQTLKELVSDILLISIDYYLKTDKDYFDKRGVFGKKDVVFYQYTCQNCNSYNLRISNKSESKPNKCQYCNEHIANSKGKLKLKVLVLEDDKLRTTSNKL